MTLQNETIFINGYVAAFTDNVADPQQSRWYTEFDSEIRYGVAKSKKQQVVLNNGQTYALSFVNPQLSDWHCLVVRCKGTGQVQTVGKDFDGTTTITANIPVTGVSYFPGILFLSTYNLTSVTISSSADGSTFEILDALCVQDGT